MKTLLVVLVTLLLAACGGSRAEPTPTVVPVPTADLLETYRPAMIEHSGALAEGLHAVTQLLADPQFDQETWIVELGGMIAQVKVAAAGIAELMPPAILADYHAAMVAASDACVGFTDVLTDAIDNIERADDYVPDRLVEAHTLIESCSSQIAAATDLIPQ